MAASRSRLRDLGITIGTLSPGPNNAITDVTGVRVGHVTLIADAPRTIRTGVTAIWPIDDLWTHNLFAGTHTLNGYGEVTGTHWIAESGCLSTPICLTSTYSVGVVRDALMGIAADAGHLDHWWMGVVGETFDGWLSDGAAMAVTRAHVEAALEGARTGTVAEGAVGGGTGSICFDFKGGIGTSSRVVRTANDVYTVGVLVQANFGSRDRLRVDGVALGRSIGHAHVPLPRPTPQDGSIIVVIATDAPLLPMQCRRLAQRATIGVGRTGGEGHNGSGDFFVAFSTENTVPLGPVYFTPGDWSVRYKTITGSRVPRGRPAGSNERSTAYLESGSRTQGSACRSPCRVQRLQLIF